MIRTKWGYRKNLFYNQGPAQENRAHANRVSILTGTTNLWFSRIRSSIMPNPNGIKFTMQLASPQGRSHSKLNKIPQAIPNTSRQIFANFF